MAITGPQASPTSSSPLLRALLVIALFLPLTTGLLLSWHSLGVLDVWLHNQVGQDILAGEGFPRTNTYSYTEPDHPWTNHEWLFQVVVGLSGPHQGESIAPGIARWNLLRAILTAALLIVLLTGDGVWSRLRRNQALPGGLCWLSLPLLGGLLLLWPRLILRPELVSFLFFVILVRVLDRPLAQWTPGGDWRDLVSLRRPLGQAFWLTVVWSQFHGFSSLAPLVLLLALGSAWLAKVLPGRKEPQEGIRGRWWLLGLPMLLLGLCLSPNGIMGLVYPLKALGQFRGSEVDLRSTISELVPLLETRDSLGATLRAYQLSLIWGLLWISLTWGRISLLRILLWVCAALAAYHGQRNIGFYGVTFILLHTGTQGLPWWGKLPVRIRRTPGPVLGLAAVCLALLVAIPWWMQIIGDDFYLSEGVSRRFGSGANPGRYPEGTAAALAENPGTRLFTNVDAAAFLLNRGQARLFIDGRTEAYSPEHWAAYEVIKRGDREALTRLEKNRPQGVFLSPASGAFKSLARTLQKDPSWYLAHFDETGLFYLPHPTHFPGSPTSSEGALAQLGTTMSPARAADLCLAWSLIREIGENFTLQEQTLRRGLEFRSNHPQLQHNLGNILLARGDNDGALALFKGALEVNSRLAGSALNAGVCQLRLGDAEKARQMFARAARINPDSFQAWANLSTACQALRDRAGALEALEKAAALQPDNARIKNMLIQLRTGR